MREVFQGWRRKSGCVALMVALAMTGMWVNSIDNYGVDDYEGVEIQFGISQYTCHNLMYGIDFTRWTKLDRKLGSSEKGARWPHPRDSDGDSFFFITLEQHWKFAGLEFGVGNIDNNVGCRIERLIIPHWLVVLPLTLLSAYLLLWQPRNRTGADHA